MNPQDICDTGLSLGLAVGPTAAAALPDHRRRRSPPPPRKPSLTLSLTPDVAGLGAPVAAAAMQRDEAAATAHAGARVREEGRPPQPQLPSPCSAASSFVAMGSVKAEAEAEAAERGSSRGSDEEDNNCSSARKKLRLTKEQSALLEDRFKEHCTLNPKQKQALAKQLNLRPRQVEVWFQNRRARTKLKQTEVDCEFLKRCYETLTSENLRLQKELQELKALKFSQPSAAQAPAPLYLQFPAATLTMCPSCERLGGGAGAPTPAAAAELSGASAVAAGSVVVPAPSKPGHFFSSPFTHSSSAAC